MTSMYNWNIGCGLASTKISLRELMLIRDALYEIPHIADQEVIECGDGDEYYYKLNGTLYPEQEIDMLAQKIDDLITPFIDVP